ncbi:Spectrin beta chain, non-erythrocytic 1, partial [Saguinus oedipus]
MNNQASRVAVVNQIARQLMHSSHPSEKKIKAQQDKLNTRWSQFRELVDRKKDALLSALSIQNYHLECNETKSWIREKTKVIESTQDLGNDLAGVMALQRKLTGMERDLVAIEAKLSDLQKEAEKLESEHPDQAQAILSRLAEISDVWEEMKTTLKNREASLGEASKLQQFLRDLDDFQSWLSRTQTAIASEDMPNTLTEAEKLLTQHENIKNEIDNYEEDYQKMRDMGEMVTQGQTDAQYMFLRQRLQALDTGWNELHKMWENRQNLLSQSHAYQQFLRDTKQAEAFLNNQEYVLAHTEMPTTLEGAEAAIKKQEDFMTTMDANEEKINAVVETGRRLVSDGNINSDRIQEKVDSIDDSATTATKLLEADDAGKAPGYEKMFQQQQPSPLVSAGTLEAEGFFLWFPRQTMVVTLHCQQPLRTHVAHASLRSFFLLGKFLQTSQQHVFTKLLLLSVVGNPRLHRKNRETASELLMRLKDNRDLQKFLQDCQEPESFESGICVWTSPTFDNLPVIPVEFTEHSEAVMSKGRFRKEASKSGSGPGIWLTLLKELPSQLSLWINEKMLTAQDMSYDEARNLHSKWLKHQAFMAELASNKEWLDKIQKEGMQLISEKPETEAVVKEKLTGLHKMWEVLESTTQTKAQRLFDANKAELFTQSCADLDKWLHGLESQIQSDDYGKDLTSVNILLKKQQASGQAIMDLGMLENQMEVRKKEIEELQSQAQALSQEGKSTDEVDSKRLTVQTKFMELLEPLNERKHNLLASKEIHQFNRDVEDEILWVGERMPLATSTDHGHNLQTVQLLIKKNQTLQKEIQGHQPRIDDIFERSQNIVTDSSSLNAETIRQRLADLKQLWGLLIEETEKRHRRLEEAHRAQQYYFDAAEAEAWMSEQELYMMSEEKAKDEQSAVSMLKKHQILEQAVEDYAETVHQLSKTSRALVADSHPESERISMRQSKVDKLYAGLKDLAEERRGKLDERHRLFQLNREVDDLEQWIAEREVVAGSHELGQDYEHMLQERFREFARDTGNIGQERVDTVNHMADELINSGHSDAATIAEWKDGLNEAWADLLELIDTRTQILAASYELHKFYHDAKEIFGRIQDKHKKLPEELGRDQNTVETLQRMHTTFEHDIQALGTQFDLPLSPFCTGPVGVTHSTDEDLECLCKAIVNIYGNFHLLSSSTLCFIVRQLQEDAARLQAAYAGDKADDIQKRENEVLEAWKSLLDACESRRVRLVDTGDKFRFFSMVRDLMLWMEDVIRQIEAQEKPRDVSSVELLMNNHQGIKAEIDARNDSFTTCIELGKSLLARKHYASEEIKEKLLQLTEKRKEMIDKWEDRWEWLRLSKDVHQFSRDASVAEAWLLGQEPYLSSREIGQSVDEVEKLIKRHEAFEKSAATWDERFSALERLTTLELLEVRRQQEEEERKRRPPSPEPSTKVSEEAESQQQWDTSKGEQVSQNGLPAEQGSPRVSYRSQTYQNYKNFNSRRTASDQPWSGLPELKTVGFLAQMLQPASGVKCPLTAATISVSLPVNAAGMRDAAGDSGSQH